MTDAMCFKPMDLSFPDCTIRKSHRGNALHFPPATPAVRALQIASNVHTPAGRNGLNVSNPAKDLESCRHPSSPTAIDLYRACSALELFKFMRRRFLHLHPSAAMSYWTLGLLMA